jgi:hypothetical protein
MTEEPRFSMVIGICFWAAPGGNTHEAGQPGALADNDAKLPHARERCQAKKPLPGGVPVGTDGPGGSCRISPGGLGRTRASGWVGSFCGPVRR